MKTPQTDDADAGALDEQDLQHLQDLLDQVPDPFKPLDVSAVDGFLCGLLLQPGSIDASQWLPSLTDVDARPLPAGFDASSLHALVLRRHAQLQHAIASRQWFDPWIFEMQAQATPSECVLPWVAGFAAAMDRFPGLMRLDELQLLEPLALIYMHFDAQDLDDADALQQVIATLEPPEDLGEAVQDLVRSVMLLADVSRPVARQPADGRPRRGARARPRR